MAITIGDIIKMAEFSIFFHLWTSMCAYAVTSKETIAFVSDMIDFTARQLSIMSVTAINPATELALF